MTPKRKHIRGKPPLPTFEPFVCLDCRRSFKRPTGPARRPCPRCGEPAVGLSQKFKPPRAGDDEQWEKVRLLVSHRFLFQTIYDGRYGGVAVPYPRSLREAREWVKKWADRAGNPYGTAATRRGPNDRT